MSRRPLPIAPPTRQEVDAGWSAIKAGLETGGAGQWRWAWMFAAAVLFVGVTAGATVLVRELRERNRVERSRREPARAEATTTHEPSTSNPAAPSEAPSISGSGSLSPVVSAANGDRPEDAADRGARRDDATSKARPKSQTRPASKSAGGAGGSAASNAGAPAVSDDARDSGRGYSPFAGMSPKTRSNDDTPVDGSKDAGDAFAAGSAARARGDFGAALAHYERFVSKHPHDERAGIAAIEAARILADHLEQPTKALRWAERAVELSAQGSVREDARARVVQLLGTLKRPRCATAQREFLRDYPNSVHAPRVQRACGEAP